MSGSEAWFFVRRAATDHTANGMLWQEQDTFATAVSNADPIAFDERVVGLPGLRKFGDLLGAAPVAPLLLHRGGGPHEQARRGPAVGRTAVWPVPEADARTWQRLEQGELPGATHAQRPTRP